MLKPVGGENVKDDDPAPVVISVFEEHPALGARRDLLLVSRPGGGTDPVLSPGQPQMRRSHSRRSDPG